MKFHSLEDLNQVKKALAAEATRRAAERERHQRAARQQRSDRALFERAMEGVEPLLAPRRVAPEPPEPSTVPMQRLRDDAAVLRESLSDEFDVSTMLHVDGYLSFYRPGIGADIPSRMRRGDWTIQAQVDLHGLRRDEAREALGAFLRQSRADGLRCVRVVHGKGLGSPGGVSILKTKVHGWLVQKQEVLAFVQARPSQGGAGALLVLLAPPPARRGG